MSLESSSTEQTNYTSYDHSFHDFEALGGIPREEWHGYVDTDKAANSMLYNNLLHTFNEPGLENYQETHRTEENPEPSQAERLAHALKYTNKLAEEKESLFSNINEALEKAEKAGKTVDSLEKGQRKIITPNLQENQMLQFEAWRHLNEARQNLEEIRGYSPINWQGLASIATLRMIPRESETEEAAIINVINAMILYKKTLLPEAISFVDNNKTDISRRLFLLGFGALAALTACGAPMGEPDDTPANCSGQGACEGETPVAERTSITPEDHEFLKLLMAEAELEPVELIYSRDGDAAPGIQLAENYTEINAEGLDLMGFATIAIPATALDPIPGDEVVVIAIVAAAGGILYIAKNVSQIQEDRRRTSHSDPRHDLGRPSGRPARAIIKQILTGGVATFCYAVTFLNNNREITRYVVTTAVQGSPYLSLMGVFDIDAQGNPRWITAYPYSGHTRSIESIVQSSQYVVASVAQTCTNLPEYGRW